MSTSKSLLESTCSNDKDILLADIVLHITVVRLKERKRISRCPSVNNITATVTLVVFFSFEYVPTWSGIGVVAKYHETPSMHGGVERLPVYVLCVQK